MKRNTTLLADQVRTKLVGKCVSAIVTEAFVNGLPFDKTELAFEAASLAEYSSKVVSKMHPETLLDRALESTANNPKANLYVQNLKTAIGEVVDTATRRIVQESLISDNPTPEIVEQAKLNDDETEKFVSASKKSGTDAVAKLVKEKMIDVIKDEKTAYETEAKIRNEIKDVIKEEHEDLKTSMSDEDAANAEQAVDDDIEDASLESYFSMILSPNDARSHISVFSKMQDVCMEAILHSNEKYYNEIPYDTMEKITLESTFPYFDLSNRTLIDELNTMLIVTESAIDADTEGEMIEEKKRHTAKTAFICTICIMTLLETLKTMHLAKPELKDVKNFVDDVTTVKNVVKTSLANVEDKVGTVVADAKKSVALGAFGAVEAAQAKENLVKVKAMLESMSVVESEVARKDRIINKINSALEAMESKDDSKAAATDSFTTRLKEENLANLEHGVKLLAQKPMVQSVQVCLRSDIKTTENSKVDVELKGLDASGACVGTYMVSIHALAEFGATLAEVIRECANYCDLGPKPVKMYFTDSGYAVPLKG